MAPGYEDYLAAKVLNESQIISYRTLSRALKVHSNAAKEMLYDFHHSQNARKPGTVHAAYFLSGLRKPENHPPVNGVNGHDTEHATMQDSSFMSSSMPSQEDDEEHLPVTCVTIAREEDLDLVKSLYDTIYSIHIYSLEPGPLRNLQVLSECNRKIAADHASEDPLETWKQYGTIHNPSTKRRTGPRPLPPPSAVAQVPMTSAMRPRPSSTSAPAKLVERKSSADETTDGGRAKKSEVAGPARRTTLKSSTKLPALKKEDSSIFKSFAKSKSEASRESVKSSNGSVASPAHSGAGSHAEDESMRDASEDEHVEDFALVDSEEAKAKREGARKIKIAREEQLRKLMEDDDDEDTPMEDSPVPQPEDEPMDAPQEEARESPASEQPLATNTGGRRRGRRRVMKKKTTKDAEGYLVTREEPTWESFSEDEPAQQKAKGPTTLPAQTAKAKKGGGLGGKPGQGSITSFFGKKP